MKGFYISVKNDLLDAKHVQQMGEAVWLYMWLLDKMTSVNENGSGKVLHSNPITYEMVYADLGMSLRTYQRWVGRLRSAGYINTIKVQYGLSIVITKAKKNFGKQSGTATNGTSEAKKSNPVVPYLSSDAPYLSSGTATNGTSLYNDYNTVTKAFTKAIKGDQAAEHKKSVSKLYYEAIKKLDLPVRNHNNVKSKIAEMARDPEQEKIIRYLEFMRDQFPVLEWDFKPHISEALDIFSKRGTVRNTFERHIKESKRHSATVGGVL